MSISPTGADSPLIAIRGADLGYGREVVLRSVNLDLYRGDLLGIVGPNGSGKTTLVRCLLGLMRPLSGTRSGPGPRQLRFGYVPQRETLDTAFPLTVLELVLSGRFGLIGPGRRAGKADREAARRALEQTGIADLADRLLVELSGGQRQRALIARALACDPEILLTDEPTNGLDLAGEHAVLDLLMALHARGMTIVVVSHQLASVATIARRVALIAGGRVRVDARDAILNGPVLSEIYGFPVRVERFATGYAILPAQEGER